MVIFFDRDCTVSALPFISTLDSSHCMYSGALSVGQTQEISASLAELALAHIPCNVSLLMFQFGT